MRVFHVYLGNVSAENGKGRGSVNCNWRKVINDKFWYSFDFGVGNGPNVGTKLFRRFSDRVFLNMSGSIQVSDHGLRPMFSASLGNQLQKNTVGYLTYASNWRMIETVDVSTNTLNLYF